MVTQEMYIWQVCQYWGSFEYTLSQQKVERTFPKVNEKVKAIAKYSRVDHRSKDSFIVTGDNRKGDLRFTTSPGECESRDHPKLITSCKED